MSCGNLRFIGFVFINVVFLFSCQTTNNPGVNNERVQTLDEKESVKIEQKQHSSSVYTYDIEDIQPVELVFGVKDLSTLKTTLLNDYSSRYNKAIDTMNNEAYSQAIDIFLKLAGEYDDQGSSFYSIAYCYYKLNDFPNALQYAIIARYAGVDGIDDMITDILFQIGYGYLKEKDYRKAIGYFKNCPGIEQAYQNVLYSYMELSSALSFPENVMMLLYAGDYSLLNKVNHENVVILGNILGSLLSENSFNDIVPRAIEIIRYGLTLQDDPYLHKHLGLLYLYSREERLAYREFENIIENKDAAKDLVTFSQDRLLEMQRIRYTYEKEIPFTVDELSENPGREGLEFIFTIPQDNKSQSVKEFRVLLNDRSVDYEIIHDAAKAQFMKIHIGDVIKKGKNKISVQASVEREAQRFESAYFEGLMVDDYKKSDSLYKMYTKKTSINDISDSEVKKMKKEIASGIKSNDVFSIVKAVYEYVIDKMSYEMYDNMNRPKDQILHRLEQKNYIGLCEDYSVLTVSLLRSFGIPSLNLAGPCYNSDIGHSWPVFFTPAYDVPVFIDTTWGDTSEMHQYYFLFNSNLTVIENFGWDSDVISGGYSTYYTSSYDMTLSLQKESSGIKISSVFP
ncbi:MAG: hypothetical protein JXJ04_18485 [Spirochaetales bacterium]|nr:hypothetical protein [Spirochaetales bacterium]